MRCPKCNADKALTLETRTHQEHIRRRRSCKNCDHRWTTHECVEFENKVMGPNEKGSKEVWCVETRERFSSATAAAEHCGSKAWVIGKAARKPGMIVAGRTWSKSRPESAVDYAIEKFDHSWSKAKKDEWFARHEKLMSQWQEALLNATANV